jgi:UV DNA damage repair endonuclease
VFPVRYEQTYRVELRFKNKMANVQYCDSYIQVPTVKEEIGRFSSHYNVRISVHPNELIASLTEPPIQRRLRRYWPHDLLVRF